MANIEVGKGQNQEKQLNELKLLQELKDRRDTFCHDDFSVNQKLRAQMRERKKAEIL